MNSKNELIPVHFGDVLAVSGLKHEIHWPKRRNEVLLAIRLGDHLIVALSQFKDLLLVGVVSRSKQVVLVVGLSFQVLDFLLAVEHLPALDAQDFAV